MFAKTMFNVMYHLSLMSAFCVVLIMVMTSLLQNAVIHPEMGTGDIVGCMIASIVLSTAATYNLFMASHYFDKWRKNH